MIPESSPENYFSIDVDDIIDVALHHEIKFRAYELYERRHDTADGHDLKDSYRPNCPVWPTRQPSFRSTPRAR